MCTLKRVHRGGRVYRAYYRRNATPPRPAHQITNTTWRRVLYNLNHSMAGHPYLYTTRATGMVHSPSCPGLQPCLCLNPGPAHVGLVTNMPNFVGTEPQPPWWQSLGVPGSCPGWPVPGPCRWPACARGVANHHLPRHRWPRRAQGHDLQQFDAPATRWPQFHLGHVHGPKACEPTAMTWTPTP